MLPTNSSPATAPGNVASPRIQTLDILRGLALMGIFIVHCVTGFSGWMFAPVEAKAAMPLAELNAPVGDWVNFLFTDKSRTLFAFMFGVSFFLQLSSAERRNEPFHGSFYRRLGVLLVLGLLHGHLVYGGDILRYYAVGGLILLVVHRWPAVWLVATGLVLALGVPLGADWVIRAQGINMFANFPAEALIDQGFQSRSFLDNLAMNHQSAVWRYLPFFLLFFAIPVTGIFLFGVWMARKGYLQHPRKHRATLRPFCAWGLTVGFGLQFIHLQLKALVPTPSFGLTTAITFSSHLAPLLIALGFVSGLVLLCDRPAWQRRLAVLAPAGRMTLTNYFVQSVLGWAVFYGSGLGLYLKIGPALTLPLALGLCAFQLFYSAWWLRHFQHGPLEWAWRWAVQGKRVPLRLVPVPATA